MTADTRTLQNITTRMEQVFETTPASASNVEPAPLPSSGQLAPVLFFHRSNTGIHSGSYLSTHSHTRQPHPSQRLTIPTYCIFIPTKPSPDRLWLFDIAPDLCKGEKEETNNGFGKGKYRRGRCRRGERRGGRSGGRREAGSECDGGNTKEGRKEGECKTAMRVALNAKQFLIEQDEYSGWELTKMRSTRSQRKEEQQNLRHSQDRITSLLRWRAVWFRLTNYRWHQLREFIEFGGTNTGLKRARKRHFKCLYGDDPGGKNRIEWFLISYNSISPPILFYPKQLCHSEYRVFTIWLGLPYLALHSKPV